MAEPRPTTVPWIRLDGRIGWRLLDRVPLQGVLAGATVALGLPGRRPIADAEPLGSFGGRKRVRGVTVSEAGRLYLADPDGRRILTYTNADPGGDAGTGVAAPFRVLWPARPLPEVVAHDPDPATRSQDPYTLVRPTDIACACNGDLVIADAGARRLLVVAPDAMTLKAVTDIPGPGAGTGAGPWALALTDAGRILLADHDGGRVWRLDAGGRLDPGYRGTAGPEFAPSHVAALPDGEALVISRGRVQALDARGRLVDRDIPDRLAPLPFAYAGGELSAPSPPRTPLRMPGIVLDRAGLAPVAGQPSPRALPLLARPGRVVRPRSGQAVFGPFDAGQEGFAWDRLALSVDMPARTRIVVSTRVADTPLESSRVAEGPWPDPLALNPGDKPDILIQQSAGRYLWVRLEFFGDGVATPDLRALEIFGPRDSGMAFLPPPFHQDPVSADFVDRLLSLFEVQRSEVQAVARTFPSYLDPQAVPPGFLDWLGAWFGWTFRAEWSEATRRDMIARSMAFFRKRGTVEGLRAMLQWHTGLADPMPAVVEDFRIAQGAEGGEIWLAGARQTDPAAHAFTVVMPASAVPGAEARATIEALIEVQKPAHTRARLCLIGSGLRVRDQALLGVDTWLAPTGGDPLGVGQIGQTMQTADGAGPVLGATTLAREC